MSVVSVRAWVWCACVSVLCMNTCVCVHTCTGECAWGMHAVCAYICSRGVCCMDGVGGVGMCMLCGVWCACAHGCVYGMHCAYSHRWCAVVCGLWCVVSMACSCVCGVSGILV